MRIMQKIFTPYPKSSVLLQIFQISFYLNNQFKYFNKREFELITMFLFMPLIKVYIHDSMYF